ncbi:hypothetical protein A2619_03335, partial [candidate division WWE3 bacterium RIFOXYD1_FULL_39_9]
MANKKNNAPHKMVPIKKRVGLFNNIFFYILLIFVFYLAMLTISDYSKNVEKVSIGEVITYIRDEKVQDVTIAGDTVEVLLKDGTTLVSDKESSISFDELLKNNDLNVSMIAGDYKVEHRMSIEQILTPILMFGFPLLILFFIYRQMRSSSGEIFSFGRSRARIFSKGQSKITFKDVAGIEEAKREMMEIVDFLKFPQKYRKLGARIPKGVLLVGPSGVGKTLLAKAIAGEANVPFFSAAGSEFMEMLVGVGSSRVRDLFRMAREGQPSLIFIDEVDAIGRQRGMGIGGGHDEREQTLNQILIEMDGFDTRTDVIVLAATNRPDMLDPALVRPGRFDRKITIPLPDLHEREAIIKIHMRGKPFADDLRIDRVAKKTVGFSGADLENMLNEAAILAARAGKDTISQHDVEEAALKVTLGSERKTLQTEEERKIIAYHEAGHALVSVYVPDMDPVYRVSIIARGGSLGHTSFPPERDRYNETKTRLQSMISTMLGGRSAEELMFNEITIGAADDIDKATKLARRMVTEFGMSALGPVSYNGREQSLWLAREIGESNQYSQEVAARIDKEVERIMEDCHAKAYEVLKEHKDKLDKIAGLLLEKETLYEDEFKS